MFSNRRKPGTRTISPLHPISPGRGRASGTGDLRTRWQYIRSRYYRRGAAAGGLDGVAMLADAPLRFSASRCPKPDHDPTAIRRRPMGGHDTRLQGGNPWHCGPRFNETLRSGHHGQPLEEWISNAGFRARQILSPPRRGQGVRSGQTRVVEAGRPTKRSGGFRGGRWFKVNRVGSSRFFNSCDPNGAPLISWPGSRHWLSVAPARPWWVKPPERTSARPARPRTGPRGPGDGGGKWTEVPR